MNIIISHYMLYCSFFSTKCIDLFYLFLGVEIGYTDEYLISYEDNDKLTVRFHLRDKEREIKSK